jgi:hypothetical protein
MVSDWFYVIFFKALFLTLSKAENEGERREIGREEKMNEGGEEKKEKIILKMVSILYYYVP